MTDIQGETYIHSYSFPPGTKVVGPQGEGMCIGVLRLWFRSETMYSVLIDGTDHECWWVSEEVLLAGDGLWKVTFVPERLPETFP